MFSKVRADLSCGVQRIQAKDKSNVPSESLPPGIRYEDADTRPILIIIGDSGENTFKIPFAQAFKLLGSTLASNLEDASEIELRKKVPGAFSAIRTQFFSAKGIKNAHKKTAYEGLIFSILLYG